MHKSKSVMENETYKIFWDFEMQTDHSVLTRRPDLVVVNKKKKKKKRRLNLVTSRVCCPGGPQSKNQRKQKQCQLQASKQRTEKKLWNMKVTVVLVVVVQSE